MTLNVKGANSAVEEEKLQVEIETKKGLVDLYSVGAVVGGQIHGCCLITSEDYFNLLTLLCTIDV